MSGTQSTVPAKRRAPSRTVRLDRSLEALPLFRLSDSAEDESIAFTDAQGGRWRVLPGPGDRLPGTFDQDVYIELLRRFGEEGSPLDGVLTFTLHSFLRAMGRRVDGRTYEQLRSALGRLERTTCDAQGIYASGGDGEESSALFTILTAVAVERRRTLDREQLQLFSSVTTAEPGVARVVLSPVIRASLASNNVVTLSISTYWTLGSPVARRLYRLLEVAREEERLTWRIALDRLAEQMPLSQRYPSHLQRVLQPAHDMLIAAGVLRNAVIRQHQREWFVDYMLGSRPA